MAKLYLLSCNLLKERGRVLFTLPKHFAGKVVLSCSKSWRVSSIRIRFTGAVYTSVMGDAQTISIFDQNLALYSSATLLGAGEHVFKFDIPIPLNHMPTCGMVGE